ncbi:MULTISPECIES: hypothetical protein [Cryobacterium]|uniref:hypothetical protein n=1 Tax=Cryobacterium TaxID=69578 RepID=UPI000CD437A4|nr:MULTISPECIES: hypothetical protein [Cryobacterium]POH63642.1 hypothetical protein C3B60_16135 [Cryobacterium zongtaii]TFC45569.1 hypothetical protein E3O57_07950 [Cryobacterium sp. TMN-39-2]
MSLATNIQDLATRIGTEFKGVYSKIGALTGLTTTDKSSLVAAVNEVKASISGAGAVIDDVTARTTTVYSSSKTDEQIATASAATKSEILGGAGAAYDTLKELQDLMVADDSADQSFVTATNAALGNRVRFDSAQTLTAAEKLQATSNAGAATVLTVGDTTTDFVATFNTGLV